MAAKKKTTTRNRKNKKKATKKPAKAAEVAESAVADEKVTPLAAYLPSLGTTDLAASHQALDAMENMVTDDGRRLLVPVNQAPNSYMLRRPCGITELDVDLGGGIPAGGACFLSGPDNSGKTWLLLRYMAMQQKLYGENCILGYAPAEGGVPFDQAARAGLVIPYPEYMIAQWQQSQTDRGLPPFTREQLAPYRRGIGRFEIIPGAYGEEMLETIIKLVQLNCMSIIGIDSVQALNPLANLDKTLDENDKRAAHAMMMQRFFDRFIPFTRPCYGDVQRTSLVMTQQVRANPDKATAGPAAKYLADYAISGGYAMRHYKLIDLLLYDGKTLAKGEGASRKAYGKVIKWKTEKGKAGSHDNMKGEFQFIYNSPSHVDFTGTAITAGQLRGIIIQEKNRIRVLREGKPIPELDAPSYKALHKMMEMDFEFDLAVRREVMATAGIRCLYR